MMNASRKDQIWFQKQGFIESSSNPRIFLTEDGVPVNTIYVNFARNPAIYQENVVRKMFEKFGPVTKVKIITKINNDRFAFISYERCEDARQCLVQKRDFPLMFLNTADSWQQDAYNKRNAHNKGDAYSGDSYILQLNDDCLMLIFNHLSLMDLIALQNTCTRLASVVRDVLRRYKSFDFTEPREKPTLTILDTKNILESVGPFVQHLSMTRDRFAQSKSTSSSRILGLIPRNCLHLKELNIQSFEMKPADLNALEVIVKSLDVLTLHGCGLDDYVGRFLGHCRNLERLRLSNNSGINGTCLQVIKGLKGLNVARCSKLKLSTFIKNNPQIEYLDITGCVVHNNTFDLISRSTELIHLACNDHYITGMITKVADIPNIKKLELTISDSQCTDKILQLLAERNCLEYLELKYVGALQLQLKSNFVLKMTKLKELKILGNPFPVDEFIDQLCKRTNIEGIHMLNYTRSGLAVWLHRAVLYRSTDNSIQYKLIEIVKKNPHLKLLDLSGMPGTEEFLPLMLDAMHPNGSFLEVIVGRYAWEHLQRHNVDLIALGSHVLTAHRHQLKMLEQPNRKARVMIAKSYKTRRVSVDEEEDFLGFPTEKDDHVADPEIDAVEKLVPAPGPIEDVAKGSEVDRRSRKRKIVERSPIVTRSKLRRISQEYDNLTF